MSRRTLGWLLKDTASGTNPLVYAGQSGWAETQESCDLFATYAEARSTRAHILSGRSGAAWNYAWDSNPRALRIVRITGGGAVDRADAREMDRERRFGGGS